MLAAFGRLTLGSTTPTKWTFLTPMIVGALGVPIAVLDPILSMFFPASAIALVAGVLGAMYLFFFGHIRRAAVFLAGGFVGMVVWLPLSLFLQSLFH